MFAMTSDYQAYNTPSTLHEVECRVSGSWQDEAARSGCGWNVDNENEEFLVSWTIIVSKRERDPFNQPIYWKLDVELRRQKIPS